MDELTTKPDPEIVEIARRISERAKKAPNISAKMVDGVASIRFGENNDTDDRLKLMAALGTYDLHFLGPLISQIGNSVSAKNEIKEDTLQFVVAFIKSIEPESEMETMLAAQMAAVHVCALDASRRYFWTDSLAGKDSAERALTKLTRTFTTQMEALKRHRAKAQQTVCVERVNVESGGQAIVGDVSAGGRVEHEK